MCCGVRGRRVAPHLAEEPVEVRLMMRCTVLVRRSARKLASTCSSNCRATRGARKHPRRQRVSPHPPTAAARPHCRTGCWREREGEQQTACAHRHTDLRVQLLDVCGLWRALARQRDAPVRDLEVLVVHELLDHLPRARNDRGGAAAWRDAGARGDLNAAARVDLNAGVRGGLRPHATEAWRAAAPSAARVGDCLSIAPPLFTKRARTVPVSPHLAWREDALLVSHLDRRPERRHLRTRTSPRAHASPTRAQAQEPDEVPSTKQKQRQSHPRTCAPGLLSTR